MLSLALVEEQRKIIRPILARHDGREVKTMGDAFLVEFSNAVDAVRCAYDIQRAVREFNLSLSPDKRIHLRIGVHLGEVQESQGDISGDAVNVASRIEPLAEDGGLCLTQQVYDHVHTKIDLPLSSLGLRALKNVDSPVEVYRMEMPWEDARKDTTNSPKERIAVLPFVSMSPDPNDEFFADGLTEELIGKISQIRGLEVIARTSVMSFKKKDKMVSEIARQLRVGTVVEGSVRKAGNRIRVTVQVIDASTEGHLFSNNYDSTLDDIFAVQSEVASKVADSIPGTVMGSRGSKRVEEDTRDGLAYTLFLQGMQLVYNDEEEPLKQALNCFEQAVARDPKFARAHAGLARCYVELGNGGYIQWSEAIDKGRAAAMKALEINPDLAEGHSVMASLMFMGESTREATRAELQKALALNPNLAEAEYYLAQLAATTGDTAEMTRAMEKAYQLDPLSPDIIRVLGIFYFYGGRIDDALNHWKKTMNLNPYGTYRVMFDYHVTRGEYEQADRTVKEMERIGPTLEYTYLNRGYLAAVTGDLKTAQDMIARLDSTHNPGWVRSSSAGFIYLGLGDLEKFFEYMFRAADDDTLPAAMLRYNPIVAKARSDPRFPEIFRRVGLPYEPQT
ncbi:MAG TPA: tetratricopeptide repeat protein [Nitrososphaerales archaeon]|nr:tetratricopeptide repeat protein [Nitrososphaerales archaeon]